MEKLTERDINFTLSTLTQLASTRPEPKLLEAVQVVKQALEYERDLTKKVTKHVESGKATKNSSATAASTVKTPRTAAGGTKSSSAGAASASQAAATKHVIPQPTVEVHVPEAKGGETSDPAPVTSPAHPPTKIPSTIKRSAAPSALSSALSAPPSSNHVTSSTTAPSAAAMAGSKLPARPASARPATASAPGSGAVPAKAAGVASSLPVRPTSAKPLTTPSSETAKVPASTRASAPKASTLISAPISASKVSGVRSSASKVEGASKQEAASKPDAVATHPLASSTSALTSKLKAGSKIAGPASKVDAKNLPSATPLTLNGGTSTGGGTAAASSPSRIPAPSPVKATTPSPSKLQAKAEHVDKQQEGEGIVADKATGDAGKVSETLRENVFIEKDNKDGTRKLVFDEEEHKYWFVKEGGDKIECKSVTTVLGTRIFEPFKADLVINCNYERWQSPEHKRYSDFGGKSKEEIKQMWEQKRDDGTEMHRKIELLIGDGKIRTEGGNLVEFDCQGRLEKEVEDGLKKFFTEYIESVGYGIVQSELRLGSEMLKLAGTADLVARAANGNFTIVDWKRTEKDITPSFGGKMCGGPLKGAGLPASDLSKYSLQLNLYKMLLTEFYALKGAPDAQIVVDKMLIVQLHPLLPGGVTVTEVRDMSAHMSSIQKMLKDDACAAANGHNAEHGEPAANGSPAVNGEAAVNEKPAVNGEAAVNEKPAMNGEPVVNGEPAVNGGPALNGEPAVNGGPALNGELAVNGGPTVDGGPTVTPVVDDDAQNA